MKKILLWILTFLLSFAFVACGAEEKTSQSTSHAHSSEITDALEKEDSLSSDAEDLEESNKQENSSIESSEATSEEDSGDEDSSSKNEDWADIEFPRP